MPPWTPHPLLLAGFGALGVIDRTMLCFCSALAATTLLAPVPTGPDSVPSAQAQGTGTNPAPDGTKPVRPNPLPDKQPEILRWRNGSPVLVSEDGKFSFRPLGQLIADAATTTGSRDPARNIDKTGVRAAHMGFAGTVTDHFTYQVEIEFAGGPADILWAYAGWRGRVGGVGVDVLLGNIQNDRSVEGSSGGEALPFAEANFVAAAIAPERGGFGFGVQGRLTGARWHASLAVTGDDIDARVRRSDDRMVLGRAHWNPVKGKAGTLHLGGWAFDERFSGAPRTLSPAANVAHGLNPFTVLKAVPLPEARGNQGRGIEAGGVAGPFWVMAEAGWRTIDLPRADAHAAAQSVSAGWFLTGGPPPYAAATGGFGRPVIRRGVFEGGTGEIELTARYQQIRFHTPDRREAGATLTGGVNWYLNSLMRVMANASAWRLHPDARAPGARRDRGTSFVLRTQIVF